MDDRFRGSRLKIERANHHIADIFDTLVVFSGSGIYDLRIEKDLNSRQNFVCCDVDLSKFPADRLALTIGDALHNLRSALDHLYYQVVLACGGSPTNWTRFPIRNSRESLENTIAEALEKQQINALVQELIITSIKSYQGGNSALWGLHQCNIRDKHEILIPVLKLVGIFDLRLENERGRKVGSDFYLMDESSKIRLREADDRTVTIKNKGHISANILFDIGAPEFRGEAVYPTLTRISEEVSRTIEAFDVLLG